MKRLDKIISGVELDEAIDIFMSHVIQDYLPDARAWEAKKADIPNGLGKHVEIESVKGDEVKLKCGAVIVPESGFILRGPDGRVHKHPNQKVWKVKTGSIDHKKYTKDAAGKLNQRQMHEGPKPAAVKGGGVTQKHLVEKLGDALWNNAHKKAQDGGGNPFGFMAHLWEVAEKSGDQKAKDYLSLVLSPLPISSLAFVLRDDSDEFENPLADMATTAWGESDKWRAHGIREYMAAVGRAHSAYGGYSGGSSVAELNTALARAIQASVSMHDKAIANRFGAAAPMKGALFARLNMARVLEWDLFQKIHNMEHVNDVREIVSLILDNANAATTPATNVAASGSLTTFISGLLSKVHEFSNGPWAAYPLVGKGAGPKAVETVKKCFPDEGWAEKLAALSPEQLASLIERVGASRAEASPAAEGSTEVNTEASVE